MVIPPSAGSTRSLQHLTTWFVIEFRLIYEACLCGRDYNLSNRYLCTFAQSLSVFVRVSYNAAGICDVACLTCCTYSTGPWGLLVWYHFAQDQAVSHISQAHLLLHFPLPFILEHCLFSKVFRSLGNLWEVKTRNSQHLLWATWNWFTTAWSSLYVSTQTVNPGLHTA